MPHDSWLVLAACRASIYGGRSTAASARKADPRPLTDREFISEQLNDLIRYLVSNSYNQRISTKLFNPPTGKEFKNVVTFLFRLLDEGYELTGRVEDEVPLIFKGLHYPFGISKTGLTAVGSPHTWPALLGALSWLVELLEYDAAVRAAEEAEEACGGGGGEADGGDERMFFSYLRESYAAFLDDDTQRFRDLDAEISTTFRGKHEEIEAETDALEEEAARMRAELEELRAQRTQLPTLEAKRADLVSDKGKFETLIEQLDGHKAALDQKLAQREEEAEGKEREQQEAEAALAAVRHTIETQELSTEDVERIRAQQQRNLDKAAATGKQKEEARRELAEAEAVLAAAIEGLEGQLAQYHKAAASLHLLAPDDENAAGIDFELELDTTHLVSSADLTSDTIGTAGASAAMGGRRESVSAQLSKLSAAEILGTDVRGVIKPALRELKTSLHRRTIEERGRETELADAAEATSEAVEDCKQRLQEADRRVQSLTETFKRERAANERTLQQLVEETDAAEKQVEEAREALQAAEDEASSLDERTLRRVREESTRRVQVARARADAALSSLRQDTLAVTRHVEAVRRRLHAAAAASESLAAAGAAEIETLAARVEAACAEEAGL